MRDSLLVLIVAVGATAQAAPLSVNWSQSLPSPLVFPAVREGLALGPGGDIYARGSAIVDSFHERPFVRRYDPSGGLKWQSQLDIGANSKVSSLATDRVGNVFVTGLSESNDAMRKTDGFLAKLDNDGNTEWGLELGTLGYEFFNDVVTDLAGNVIIGGSSSDQFGDSAWGDHDAIVAKYRTDGELLWAKQVGTRHSDHFFTIDTDKDGNVYATGMTSGNFARGNGDLAYCGHCYGNDVLLMKFDPSGTELWRRQFGASGVDSASAIAVDSIGNIFVVGQGQIAAEAPWNENSGFVAKFDSEGQRQWITPFGTGGKVKPADIAVDESGVTYVASSLQIGGNSGPSDLDATLSQFSAEGDLLWTTNFAGNGLDSSADVEIGEQGQIYMLGLSQGGIFPNNSPSEIGFLVSLSQVPEPATAGHFVIALGTLLLRRSRKVPRSLSTSTEG